MARRGKEFVIVTSPEADPAKIAKMAEALAKKTGGNVSVDATKGTRSEVLKHSSWGK